MDVELLAAKVQKKKQVATSMGFDVDCLGRQGTKGRGILAEQEVLTVNMVCVWPYPCPFWFWAEQGYPRF